MKLGESIIEERSSSGLAQDARNLVKKAKTLPEGPVDPKLMIRREAQPGKEENLALLIAEIDKASMENIPATQAEACEIMGVDFLGPEAVEKTFGTKLAQVPAIPFTRKELEAAKQRGEYLHLEVDTLANGQPLTMQNLAAHVSPRFTQEQKGKVLLGPSM